MDDEMNTPDGALLEHFLHRHSEDAFARLVRRHLEFVHSTAVRHLPDDPESARDVSQVVFSDLARNAAKLVDRPSLMGWLHTATRLASANARRGEHRRRLRETLAHSMNSSSTSSSADWPAIRAVIDDALGELPPVDREAVLLRHFGSLPWAEVGNRLGMTETAARLRVDRAMQRLRDVLARGGIVSTAAALGTVLAQNAVLPAPADLLPSILRKAGAIGRVQTTGHLVRFATPGRLILSLASMVAVLFWMTGPVPTPGSVESTVAATSPNSARRIAQLFFGTHGIGQSAKASGRIELAGHPLELTVLANPNDTPLVGGKIELRTTRQDGTARSETFVTGDSGTVRIPLPPDATKVEIFTRIAGCADTRLHWDLASGEVPPSEYVLRLVAPAAISGQMVDNAGNPIRDAEMSFNHWDSPGPLNSPEDHQFAFVSTHTDSTGHWSLRRIAPDVLPFIYGGPIHPDFVAPPQTRLGFTKSALDEMLAGTHVFRMEPGEFVRGVVRDLAGAPVFKARIHVAGPGAGREAVTDADGSFVMRGCPTGELTLTAEASGFAPRSLLLQSPIQASPLEIVLPAARSVRFRVVDRTGAPVANAWLCPRTRPPGPIGSGAIEPNIDTDLRANADGVAVWNDAPREPFYMDVRANGFLAQDQIEIGADCDDTVVVLTNALTVTASVRDSVTGEPIQWFRVRVASPISELDDEGNLSTNLFFHSIERFVIDGSNGSFRHAFDEAPILGEAARGIRLRFEAEGYLPSVSRLLHFGDDPVELAMVLQPAPGWIVTVLGPDREPAPGADIGILRSATHLDLDSGGLALTHSGDPSSLAKTDAQGQFHWSPDGTIQAVLFAHPTGFARLKPGELLPDEPVVLSPWGHISAVVHSTGHGPAGETVSLRLFEGDNVSFISNPSALTDATDLSGVFNFTRVPPGRHELLAWIPVGPDGATVCVPVPIGVVEVRAGETARFGPAELPDRIELPAMPSAILGTAINMPTGPEGTAPR